MSISLSSQANVSARRRMEYIRGFAILLIVAVAGLFIAKWQPYFLRTLTIMAKHAYPGSSIVSGKAAAPPPASFGAAIGYAQSYFLAIWQALVVGLLLAATIEALVPRDWIARVLGQASPRSAALGGLMSLPAMMCTCCVAPVAVGLRKAGAAAGAATTFFLGNPTLNPAVLVFLLLTLGWKWALLRAVLGAALVAAGAFAANRLAGSRLVLKQPELEVSLPADRTNVAVRWLRSLGRLVITLLPEYIVIVFLLGALRTFFFPAQITQVGNNPLAMVLLAIAGTLFVIPTAGEIPIILTMQSFGLGSGLAGVLLLTLAPLSLPSLAMISRVLPLRVLAALAGLTAFTGLVAGVLAAGLRL